MSTDFRFATSVGAFGLALKSQTDRQTLRFDRIASPAAGALRDDP